MALEAGQSDPSMPNGPELTQIDESYIGQNVMVEKSSPPKKVQQQTHVHDETCAGKH